MTRKLLGLLGVIILVVLPISAASAVFASSGTLTLDWTVNVSVIVTIGAATGSFIVLSLKTQWRVDALSKRVGRHDELFDRLSTMVSGIDKQMSLMQQQGSSYSDTMKQVGEALNLVARQDERLLSQGRELAELRARIRELENAD
jgi:hypothetical protein